MDVWQQVDHRCVNCYAGVQPKLLSLAVVTISPYLRYPPDSSRLKQTNVKGTLLLFVLQTYCSLTTPIEGTLFNNDDVQ